LKINQRGQSALEYLMTYGWALVVIVVVVAALVLLVGNPTAASDRCNSPSAGFSIENAELGTDGWNIVLVNLTGKTVDTLDLTTLSAPTTGVTEPTYTQVTNIAPGTRTTVTAPAVGIYPQGSYQTTLTITYDDGLDHTLSVTCNGTA
jgi:hypothetical protein